MNILIAPNSMKGSLSAIQFADIIESAFKDVDSNYFACKTMPIADGGDGTCDIITKLLNLNEYQIEVQDPLCRNINVKYGFANEVAVIEMANVSGLKLLNESEKNPMIASSFGTGQVLAYVVKQGAKRVILGVGGSATVDGGMGLLDALGVKFYDSNEKRLKGNAENLIKIARIEDQSTINNSNVEIIVLSDVENSLLGEFGAARVFSPQKGATPVIVNQLEQNMEHFAEMIFQYKQTDVKLIRSGGAAGGVVAGLKGFFNVNVQDGAKYILELMNINEHISWSDVVITGEGSIDSQTAMNKAPYVLATLAHDSNKPVIGISGSIPLNDNYIFDALFSIVNKPMDLYEAILLTEKLTYSTSKQIAKLLLKLS